MVVYEDTELTPHLHPQWIYQKYNCMLSSSLWKWRGNWHNNFSTTKGREKKLPGGKATHRRGRQYHRLGDLPWGAWSSIYLSGTPALGSSSGKMSPLAGLKTGRACWRAARNRASAFEVCMHVHRLAYSHPTPTCLPAPAQWRGSRLETAWCWLPCQHTLWPALGPCSSSSCSGTALHYSKGCHCQQEHTHLEGTEMHRPSGQGTGSHCQGAYPCPHLEGGERTQVKILVQKDTCAPMFTAALFTTAKIRKQPKCVYQQMKG